MATTGSYGVKAEDKALKEGWIIQCRNILIILEKVHVQLNGILGWDVCSEDGTSETLPSLANALDDEISRLTETAKNINSQTAELHERFEAGL